MLLSVGINKNKQYFIKALKIFAFTSQLPTLYNIQVIKINLFSFQYCLYIICRWLLEGIRKI